MSELQSTYGSADQSVDPMDIVTTDHERSILHWLNAAYDEAMALADQSEELREVDKYIGYLLGKQWPSRRPGYKAAPVNNRLWKILVDLVSYLTDIRPTWQITANNKLYEEQATLLTAMTESWWLGRDVDLALAQIVVYAALSTGYGRLTWNDKLAGGLGDMELIACAPGDVLPLSPAGMGIQSCQGVIYKNIRPLSWFRSKYGKRGALVKPDVRFSQASRAIGRPAYVAKGIWEIMSPQMQKMIGTRVDPAQSVYPVSEYREHWLVDDAINTSDNEIFMGDPNTNWCYKVPPREKLYPRGRLLVTGGGVLLSDGPNPFWHGRFPFEKLCLNTVPWQWYGPSEFKVQLPLQDVINQLLAGVLDVIKKAVNPVLIAPENAFSTALRQTIEAGMPGAKLFYSQAAAAAPTLSQPPQLPGYVMDTLVYAQREMDSHSGILDLSGISQMGQIPAADTLEQLKSGQQSVIRLKGRYIEVFLRDIGTQGVSNFLQFWSAERRLQKYGIDGLTLEDFEGKAGMMVPKDMDPQKFAKSFTFNVKPGSLLNDSRVQRGQIMLMLRKMGEVDRVTLLESLELGPMINKINAGLNAEGKDILKNLVKQKLQQQQGGGSGQLLNALQGSAGGGDPATSSSVQ